MASGYWFLLHQNNKLLTIQTIKDPLIVASTHKETMNGLMHVLREHKVKTNKWMHKCRMYNENVLHLIEQEPIDGSLIQMAYLDMNDDGCVQTLRNMYYIHNMRVFMMTDFDFSVEDETPLLSVQGFALQNGPSKENEDFMNIHDYLDFIYHSN